MAAAQPNHYVLPPKEEAWYTSFEPYFDEMTMRIHHQRHHQAYITNSLNLLADLPAEVQSAAPEELITKINEMPEGKRMGLRNNVGGHVNHTMFWEGLKQGTQLSGALKEAIDRDFGGFDQFRELFETAAKTRFGSGWAWLVLKADGKLAVCSTANQDNPLMGEAVAGCSGYPIVGLDVWEHAYYILYQNKRPDYIAAFWNVCNWDYANARYEAALKA